MSSAKKKPSDGQCEKVQSNRKKCPKEAAEYFESPSTYNKGWLCATHLKRAKSDEEQLAINEKLNNLRAIENAYNMNSVLTIGDVYLYQCNKCFSFIASGYPPNFAERGYYYLPAVRIPSPPQELQGHIDYHYQMELEINNSGCRCCDRY